MNSRTRLSSRRAKDKQLALSPSKLSLFSKCEKPSPELIKKWAVDQVDKII